ncbi:MAG TPA: murein L,D-transpeptidase catalytic domain family protein [Gemmatimonadaceae bacterium]
MGSGRHLQNVLIGATAVVFAGALFAPGNQRSGPILNAATSFVTGRPASADSAVPASPDKSTMSMTALATETRAALSAFASVVRPLSHPQALADAFRSYFAFKAAHPGDVKKPFLYFVDYGLPSTTPRGYVFDMSSLKIVDGPFTVAHGRGSSTTQYGLPTRFSNAFGSAATSLGLYLAKATYAFHGHSGGQGYNALGLRLMGVSAGFNDNAFARGVVAHGAPYVTPTKAGRSEGCPAMEPSRAERLLPELADGGMVFLFAPDAKWMTSDPWVASGGN